MRPERITLNQAQNVWNAIKTAVPGIAKFNGDNVTLPDIDMAAIFAGRKSMTAAAVVKAVNAVIVSMELNR